MKKSTKNSKGLFDREIKLTFSEELNKLKGKPLATKKVEEANRVLKNLKSPMP